MQEGEGGECARGKRGRVCKREEGESVQEGRGGECARGKRERVCKRKDLNAVIE